MNDELWRVQLRTGEVRMMTIEGIDRAFDEGVIDARTHVLAPGAAHWSTLGDAAGLEDPALADTLVADVNDQTPSLSPVAISNATPSIPPTSTTTAKTNDPLLPGLDPLADLDDLEVMPRRRRAPLVVGIVGAAMLAATLALVLGKAAGGSLGDAKASNAVQAPAAAEPLPAPAVDPQKDKPQLNEEQKKKLLEADKAREEKARAKNQEKAEKAERSQRRKTTKSGPVFVNGGDKYDPLNGKL